jgi:23S rRNA (cytidine1920-2'-O)/16S rRNA (cytidine1409-2'-O)-methyltransferase
MPARQRLDEALVARGFYRSRARARDAILRGTVSVDGVVAARPAQAVAATSFIALADEAQHYVSRAALKLKHGLAHFGVTVEGRHALDIGASAGGFSQVLIENGAAHVTAIDVGHGQMKFTHPRVTLIEGLNARELDQRHLAHTVELIVCDVSFISLKLALPKALALVRKGASLVALIKPQFEVGRNGDAGDPDSQSAICAEVASFLESHGWSVTGWTPSPIAGSDGSREFLIAAGKS